MCSSFLAKQAENCFHCLSGFGDKVLNCARSMRDWKSRLTAGVSRLQKMHQLSMNRVY